MIAGLSRPELNASRNNPRVRRCLQTTATTSRRSVGGIREPCDEQRSVRPSASDRFSTRGLKRGIECGYK